MMTHRAKRMKCIIYPEDDKKMYYDGFMSVIVIMTCVYTPLDISIEDFVSNEMKIVLYVVDFIFFIDILINFNSAYYDDQFNIKETRKEIGVNYVKGWFFLDLLAILPMEAFGGDSSLSKISRLGKITRLTRVIKLVKVVNLVKQKQNTVKMTKNTGTNLGLERFGFFIICFMLGLHIAACVWIVTATIFSVTIKENDEEIKVFPGTWIGEKIGNRTAPHDELYAFAFYWAVQTVTTVGYGDIGSYNMLERWITCLTMIIGVISFSFASGTLASIMQNYDSQNKEQAEKMEMLNKIYHAYKLPLELYI